MHERRKLISLLVAVFILNVGGDDVAEEKSEDLWRNNNALEKFNLLSLDGLIQNYEGNENKSTCNRDISLLRQAVAQQNGTWAWKMLDASSKIPAGIMEGNFIDLGMYDECVSVREKISSEIEIRGRHCMYTLEIKVAGKFVLPVPLSISICLPASCGPKDVEDFIKSVGAALPQNNIDITASSVLCSSVDKKIWDLEFIIFFSLLIILLAFLIGCSFYDALHDSDDKEINVFRKFSLQRNAAAILSTKVKQDNFPVVHGLRVLSMAWVVLGHEFVLNFSSPVVNKVDITTWMRSWTSLYIFTAPFAVDTFFTVSGFLMTYLFLKHMTKSKSFNIPMYYIHRYVRLTPSLIALLIFSIVFVPKIGSGALWEPVTDMLVGKCRKKWWPLLLYVQNFVEKDNVCLGHLWYLAVDMQLFWISPIILYPLYRVPEIGLAFTALLLGISLITTASIISINKYPVVSLGSFANRQLVSNAFQDVYEKPYVRAGPWLLGIILGFEIANKHRKMGQRTVWIGWLVTVAAFSFCIFGTRYFMDPSYKYNVVVETFFATICRPIWALGICWIIYASAHNRAGFIQRILSWKALLPLSRLSYCIYLVHFVIQILHVASIRTPSYFIDYFVWRTYFGDLVISVLIAFLFSLTFESPILVLEKLLLRRS